MGLYDDFTTPAKSSAREIQDFLDDVETLRDECPWARTTLDGIFDTVSRTGHVTHGQREAIDHVRYASERRSRR